MRRETGTRFCELGLLPNNGMSTAIPDVAGLQPQFKEFRLVLGPWLLIQGTEVPENPHILYVEGGPVVEVHFQNVCHDLQVEPRRVRMTFGS